MATYDVETVDSVTLRWFSNWLLRPDGSFGYLTQRYAIPIDAPTELLSIGGTVPPGQLRKQTVADVLGGIPPSPELAVSGIDGNDWVVHESDAGPTLLAINDRGRVARRSLLGTRNRTFALAVVPTGAGLRTILRVDTSAGPEVRRTDGTTLAHVDQLDSLRAAVGRSDGSILLSGFGQLGAPKAWLKSLIRVSPHGKVSRVRDARQKLVSGDPIAAVRGGVLIAKTDEDHEYRHQQISLFTDHGRLQNRTNLDDLDLPWSNACRADKDEVALSWAGSDSSGLPMLGVDCYRKGNPADLPLDSFIVGLDSEWHARWTVAGGERPNLGADGRFYSIVDASRLVAWRVPGGGTPRRGRVASVLRAGSGADVRIRCRADNGSVCSGTARLTRRGSAAAKTLPYALLGRPGKSSASISRHFDALPSGSGPLRVTLAP